MAKIVAGFGAPHSPSLPSVVEKNPSFVENGLYEELRRHLEEVRADVVLIFANDHFNTFFFDNFPLFAIGVAETTQGPNDQTPMPAYDIPLHRGLAAHIHRAGISHGFDLSLTQEFTVDHAFTVPFHFMAPHGRVALVPVFINGFSDPLPLATRAHALGRMIGSAIRTYEEPLRVAIFASGSFSLEIGGPQIPVGERSGVPDRKWVARVCDLMTSHRIKDLIEEATPIQMARAGNAGGELLNWIAMLGVIGDQAPISLLPQPHGHAFGIWRWE
jgi:protocatechuate 4,5-dioxygenase beta chain